MICHGCGGVVGRDCWNPRECEQITRNMAAQQLEDSERLHYAEKEIENLRDTIDKLKAQIRGMRDYAQQAHPDDVILRDYIKDILK